MLRVSFSNMATARAAVGVLEAYGYSATQFGREVVTDCPTLLAVPTIQRKVGFADIERLELTGANVIESTPGLCPPPTGPRAEQSSQASA